MATSNPGISEEEINYCRYSIGVMKVTPQVLRLIFKHQHPDLGTFLLHNKAKCQLLKSRKILTESQWNNLFPTTGAASLEEFDTSLLILMLRNLSNIAPPSTGWHTDPLPSDISLGADLLRLRKIRNDHAHCKDMRMENIDFGKKWSELTMIITRLGGLQFQQDMISYSYIPLENTNIGRIIKREMEELKKEIHLRLPENIKNRGRRILDRAGRLQNRFVKTKAYKHIKKCIKTTNVVTITGTFGSGKKTLASQLALHFSKRNYTIIPINDCQEILQCYNPDENQFFIINDPFGTSKLDTDTFAKWLKHQDDISYVLENSECSKMVFTCRLGIFKKGRPNSSFEILYRNAIDISGRVYGLTLKERQTFWTLSCPLQDHDYLLRELEFGNPSFPYLCQTAIDGSKLRGTPLNIYAEEIKKVLENKDYSFLLHLVLIRKNQLRKGEKIRLTNSEIESLNTLNIPIPSLFEFQQERHLYELEGSFLKESEGVYRFINDTVHDILTYNAASISKSIAIDICSKNFFRNNLTFNLADTNAFELSIYLQKNDFEKWFERLNSEIRNGRFIALVFSAVFTDEIIRDLFNRKVRDLPSKTTLELVTQEEEDEIQIMDHIPAHIRDIVREFPFNNRVNFLHAVLMAGHSSFFKVIWKQLKKTKKYRYFDEEDISKAAVIGGKIDCLHKIAKTLWRRKHMSPFLESKREYFYKRLFRDSFPMSISCACGHLDLVRYFHKLGFSVNEANKNGDGTLAFAARYGNGEILRYLITNHVDINTQNNEGISPLMAGLRNYAIVDLLLKHEADFRVCSNDGENALMLACGMGDIFVVNLILRFCNLRLTTDGQYTFINKQKMNGITALHKACECKDIDTGYNIVDKLLAKNATPRTCDTIQRSSPLHLAAAYDDSKLVFLLLRNQADINHTDKDGVTPLFIASDNGFSNTVQGLICHDADSGICRKTDGASPLLIAAERGHLEVVKILSNIKDRNTVNVVNNENSSPLFMATLNNHTKVCEVLIENGADVNIPNINGYNPILVASKNGNAKLVKLFLEHGADAASQTSQDKNTPLHLAVMMGNKSAVKILLARGADVEIENKHAQNPSDIASSMKQEGILILLSLYKVYGSRLPDLETGESPRSGSTISSSNSSLSSLDATSKCNSLPDNSLPDTPLRIRIRSRRIASSSVGSLVYSDTCSIVSTSSLSSVFHFRSLKHT